MIQIQLHSLSPMFGQDFMHVFKYINTDKKNLIIDVFTPICSKIICFKLFQCSKINNIFIIFYFSGFTSNSNSCTANDSNRMIQISSQWRLRKYNPYFIRLRLCCYIKCTTIKFAKLYQTIPNHTNCSKTYQTVPKLS